MILIAQRTSNVTRIKYPLLAAVWTIKTLQENHAVVRRISDVYNNTEMKQFKGVWKASRTKTPSAVVSHSLKCLEGKH